MTDSTCTVADCDKPILNKRNGWCQAHYHKARRWGEGVFSETFTCLTCSATIHKTGTGPKPKYCNRDCWREQFRRGVPPIDGRCMGCSAVLPPQGKGKTRKFCNQNCRHLKTRRPATRNCRLCDAVIDMTTRTANGNLRYPAYTKICTACKKPNRYPLTAAQLAERDGPQCKGCGIEVDFTAVKPDPFSPSVDHIIPWSRGGANEAHNLQLMHLRCNIVKGTN